MKLSPPADATRTQVTKAVVALRSRCARCEVGRGYVASGPTGSLRGLSSQYLPKVERTLLWTHTGESPKLVKESIVVSPWPRQEKCEETTLYSFELNLSSCTEDDRIEFRCSTEQRTEWSITWSILPSPGPCRRSDESARSIESTSHDIPTELRFPHLIFHTFT